ncbi:MAG TPA: NAD-dependent epimerase/dehydratase family protein [Candidatus Paceibacterota bacterium]|nr:NAD-dependent epimerase/dehydratase family protein [Verrucomicrobiota bacterium]HSA11129.1 NAD-dependent epimerase/dehydratase family protein [Candidatus Paceibacterota bacterium]
MKILLTGASGFVGSHILDSLRGRGLPTALLLRPGSNHRFITRHLADVEVRPGSIGDLGSLRRAMTDITHVIHCAGATRAGRIAGFYEANQAGTREVVSAVNEQKGRVQRLVHISSLAAAGPAPREKPALEEDSPAPVSEYGKSKLAGELEVRNHCHAEHVILRPPAVYGPRDGEFLRLFRAVRKHVLPRLCETQALSLVFAKDLAETVVACLTHAAAAGRTYFVAGREVVTARTLADEVAAQMNVWTLPLPLPTWMLWPVCLAREGWSRLTGQPSVLSLQKFAELRAPGWVCDPTRLEREVGGLCATTLKQGIAETLLWYREQNWL